MKKKQFFSCLKHIGSSALKIFEFYYFVRELHEQIVCANPLICGISIFPIPIERALVDHEKCFEEVREFFQMYCLKQNNRQVFYSMFQWSTKKDQAFSTVCYGSRIRERQIKEMRRIRI